MITEFTVDRAMWGMEELRNSTTGKMCCLGFLAKACGYGDWQLNNQNYPHTDWDNIPEPLRMKNNLACPFGVPRVTPIMEHITAINDSTEYYLLEKESKLVDVFSKLGIKINFTGDPNEYNPRIG